jgi:hypothetical protein
MSSPENGQNISGGPFIKFFEVLWISDQNIVSFTDIRYFLISPRICKNVEIQHGF